MQLKVFHRIVDVQGISDNETSPSFRKCPTAAQLNHTKLYIWSKNGLIKLSRNYCTVLLNATVYV